LLAFFGEPAVTNTATSKLAAIGDATVLPYFFRRLPSGDYRVDIGAPLADFPGESPSRDAQRLFALLEDYIRLAPEQYLWLYKKFKGRPAPLPDPYAR
jgi:KDO2-lipid IV(A) lauroyltransferase